MITKSFFIAKALYPKCLLLFLFDNATSHSVYADNALYITRINKNKEKNQVKKIGKNKYNCVINGIKKIGPILNNQWVIKNQITL